MSTVFRERRYAVPATLALAAALAFGPEVLGGSYFGLATVPFFRLFGLAGWMTAGRLPVLLSEMGIRFFGYDLGWLTSARLPVLLNPIFICWLAMTHALGWVFLWRAAATLAATWQDQAYQPVRESDPAAAWPSRAPAPPLLEQPATMPEPAPARVSWLTDPRPWDHDPIRWRVERLGSAEGLIWLAVALNFLAQFGTLGPILNFGAASADTWGLVSFVGLAVILFSGALIAWAGARFFQGSRRQQDLELLLTTPLGGRDILIGQWRVLRRALAWPLGVVLALALPAGLALLYDFANDYRREFWFLLQPFLIAVNLALEAVALCWVGIRFGLRGRNSITAVAGTVGLVQLLPLALAAALMWGWAWLPARWSSLTLAWGKMPPVILALLFFVAKNVGLMVWARLRLRRELRLGRRTARLDASASGLVLQRA